MNRIRVLDGLRGYAALMVFIAHFPQIGNSNLAIWFYHIISFSKIGYLGVDIFFILSGFLISKILFEKKEKSAFKFSDFYIKRAVRILPIYYLTILFIGFFLTWDKIEYTTTFSFNYEYPFINIRYPFEHLWSLGVEEHFYLFFPMVLFYCTKNQLKIISIVIIPILSISSAFYTVSVFEKVIADKLIFAGTNFRIISLSIGVFIAVREEQVKKNIFFNLYLPHTIIVGILLYLFTLLFLFKSNSAYSSIIQLIMFSVLSFLFFIIVLKSENSNNLFEKIFTNKLILKLGMISYGFYLYHYPIVYLFDRDKGFCDGIVEINEAIQILFLSLFISFISYYFIEMKFKKIAIIYQRKNEC